MSIEFSIEWREKLDFTFKKIEGKSIRPAYLHITYRYISDKPRYCLKVSEGQAGLPKIAFLFDIPSSYPKDAFPRFDFGYFNHSYIIGLESRSDYIMAAPWYIRAGADTTSFTYNKMDKNLKEAMTDPLAVKMLEESTEVKVARDIIKANIFMTLFNVHLFIYSYLTEREEPEEEVKWYCSSDITEDSIMNKAIDKFVFLKPGETYVDKYNLVGFQLIGGDFTFQLDNTRSLDYVETDPIYKEEEYGISHVDHFTKKQLPLKAGKYELFTGDFLTNKANVYFPGIREE